MGKVQSWEVSDAFWQRVEPLIPPRPERPDTREFRRAPGGGRKRMDPRRVFGAIVYVLRTGCQWKAVSKKEFGSGSSIHKYFREWLKAGFFVALWKAGLAEYDELEGISWRWQSIDGSTVKAPLAQEAVGPNPTDRGKKRKQTSHTRGRTWRPAFDSRNRGKSP
jgi:transposase